MDEASTVPAGVAWEEEPALAYRWVIVGLMWLTQQADSLAMMSLGVLLPAMRKELGFDLFMASLVGSSNQVSQLILGIPLTVWAVRMKPKPLMIFSNLLAAAFIFLQGAAFSVWIVMLARFLASAVGNVKGAAQVLLRVQWVPRRELGLVMGLGMGMSNASQSIAFNVTPILLTAVGLTWRSALHVFGLIVLAMSLLWLIFGRERAVAPTPAVRPQQDWSQVPRLLRRFDVKLICIYWFFSLLPFNLLLLFYPTYLVESRGYSLGMAGLIMSVISLTGIVVAPLGGRLSDRVGLRRPFIWPLGILTMLGQMALFLPVSAPWLIFLAFIYGVCLWLPPSVIMAIPYELEGLSASDIALTMSIAQTAGTAGTVVGFWGLGGLVRLTGTLTLPLFLSSIGWLSRMVAGLLLPETGPRYQASKKAVT